MNSEILLALSNVSLWYRTIKSNPISRIHVTRVLRRFCGIVRGIHHTCIDTHFRSARHIGLPPCLEASVGHWDSSKSKHCILSSPPPTAACTLFTKSQPVRVGPLARSLCIPRILLVIVFKGVSLNVLLVLQIFQGIALLFDCFLRHACNHNNCIQEYWRDRLELHSNLIVVL